MTERRAPVVGLTGGIGTGKSTVAAMFRALGAKLIDADVLAREVVARGTPGFTAVVAAFGPQFVGPDGELDRAALGQKIFLDAQARQQLNAIVHPRVAALAQERMQDAQNSGAPLVVYDVPLLFENGLESVLSPVIVVYVDEATQRQRLAARDQLATEQIQARIAAQLPIEEKKRRAGYVIDNRGSLDSTRDQVEKLFTTLTQHVVKD